MVEKKYKNKEWLEENYKTRPIKDIAKECGISLKTLYKLLDQFNILRKKIKVFGIFTKELLKELFDIKKLSAHEISNIYNVNVGTIYKYLRNFNIETAVPKSHKITKDLLYSLYIDDNFSSKDIAKKFKIDRSYVDRLLRKFQIKDIKKLFSKIPETILQDLYINQQISTTEIGKKYNVREGAINNLLRRYKIPIRKNSEAVAIHHKKLENRIKKSARQQNIPLSDWRGFTHNENFRQRESVEYKYWRKLVLKKNSYTCECCGKKGGKLRVHHIENFSSNKDKRMDDTNAIVLCEKCHDMTIKHSFHDIFGVRNNNQKQLDEYVNNKNFYTDNSDWNTFDITDELEVN